ncbi:transposase [Saccharopolyspora elongata]|uniref:transposase n=1 Tax=Saccharopolyspora elongata TaxID=2530387 RepID=UPI0014046905
MLTSIPGVGVLAASAYGAALGDPHRFRNGAGAYRAAGLVRPPTNPPEKPGEAPTSAGKDRSSFARRFSTSDAE